MASPAARRSPRTSVRSLASMATSVPVPMASPRSAWASAAASLTPSPTIATTPSSCSRRTTSTLSSGSTSAIDVVGGDADLGGDRDGGPPVVAGEQHRAQAEPAQLGDGGRARRLDGVGDDEHARAPRRPSRPARRCARPPRRRPWPRRSVVVDGASTSSGSEPLATDDHGPRPSTTPVTPRPWALANPSTAGRAMAGRPGAVGDGPPDRVLRRVLEGAGQRAAPRRRSVPAAGDDVDERHRAGRDGAGLVEHDRVDAPGRLEHLGTLDDDAELGAAAGADHDRGRRGQPEGARAGDDQHGDGGGERRRRRLAGAEPEAEGGDGEGDDDRHEHGRDAVGEPLHRRLAGLGVLDEPGDLGQLGVGADAGRPHDEAAAGVDGGAGDGVAGADLDRHRLAGQQRGVDGRRALGDDAVGGDLLARAHDERSPTASWSIGMRTSPSVAQDGDVLGAELEERVQGGAGATLGAGLDVAPGEDERRHAGGDLEVQHAGAVAALGPEREAVRHAGHAGVAEEEGVQRPAERGEHAERDERVHRRGGVAQVRPRRPVERPRTPRHDGRGERQREPLPVLELQRRDHRQQDDGHRQDRRERRAGRGAARPRRRRRRAPAWRGRPASGRASRAV